jgi:site-specific recombinase XerD
MDHVTRLHLTPSPSGSALLPADVDALSLWTAVRQTQGESPRSVERAAQRLRAFARSSQHGLLDATRADLFAFVSSWSRRRALPLKQFTRETTWQLTVAALRSFYAWASTRGLVDPRRSPVRGIYLPPRRTGATLIGPKDGPLYEALLVAPRLDRRARAMLYLLAHGLTQADVVNQRAEDLHLAAGVLVLRRGSVRWSVPLSRKTVGILRDYVLEHSLSVGTVGWLFPTRYGRRQQARPDVVRDVVRRAARLTFPLPSQDAKRRRICAVGFRQLYLRRLLRTRVTPECLAELTRFDRMESIRRYADAGTPARTRHELLRVVRRWSRWL